MNKLENQIVEIVEADKLTEMLKNAIYQHLDTDCTGIVFDTFKIEDIDQPEGRQIITKGKISFDGDDYRFSEFYGELISGQGSFEVNCEHISENSKNRVDLSELEVIMNLELDV